ncbi:MAG: biotin--[acetyl-CoA-carboxylase] ligase [Acidimicrobiia bacterium]
MRTNPPIWSGRGVDERLRAARFGPVRWFDRLDSTNRYLLDEAAGGAPDGTVAVADVQDAGRGRLDRRWEAAAGRALLVSVLLRPSGLPDDAWHLATVAAGLAMSDAVVATAGVEPALKWPNDLVVDDRKLAGILAESVVTGPDSRALVVGVGCNLARGAFPDDLAGVATSVEHVTGRSVEVRDALVAFLDAFADYADHLGSGAGRERLRALARDRSATLGQVVEVEHPGGSVSGRAVDIATDGALMVEAGGERHAFHVGDVIHVRADRHSS